MKKGKNITDVLKMNRSLVALTIQKNGQISRAEISRQTGLNKATVTNIVADLLKRGTVRETGLIDGEVGRRSIGLEIAAEKYLIICIHVMPDQLQAGLFDLNGNPVQSGELSAESGAPAETLPDLICAKADAYQKSPLPGRLLGMSISLPMSYTEDAADIPLFPGQTGESDFDLASVLRERTGLFVLVKRDAEAFTMAEWYYTENQDEKASLCCLMAGQTVGGGIIEDGKLLRGRKGIAVDIGHMSIDFDGPLCVCGNRGCLEKYCSTNTLLEEMRKRLKDTPDTICTSDMTEKELIDAYLAGDPLAVSLMEEGGKYLGYGLANIIKIFNPEKIIIGGEYARAGDRLLSHVKKETYERLVPEIYKSTRISLSTLSNPILRGLCAAFINYAVKHGDDFFGEMSEEMTNV